MAVWKLKGCPRCGGDLFLDGDEEKRWYEKCLQCSFTHELKNITEFHRLGDKPAREPALQGDRRLKKESSS